MRLRIREEHRAMPAYEKPPAWRVDVYFGAANQIRTGDLILTKDVLCHLSHSSEWRPGTVSNRRPLA